MKLEGNSIKVFPVTVSLAVELYSGELLNTDIKIAGARD